MTEEKPTC